MKERKLTRFGVCRIGRVKDELSSLSALESVSKRESGRTVSISFTVELEDGEGSRISRVGQGSD